MGFGELAILALVLALAAGPVSAQSDPPPAVSIPGFGGVEAQADHFEALSADRYLLEGNVSFKAGTILLQADRLTYDRSDSTGEAVGNVLYVQADGRIAGDRVIFNVQESTAEIDNATGFLEQGFIFRARKVYQLDEERLRFEKGFFTACTQPVPYWSLKVSSGLVVRDRYVHLYNMRLRAGKMPVFYSPYLAFPIKPDRTTGLLLPQIGFSDRLGTALQTAFYWAIARNQDATFYVDAYTGGSLGTGLEYRFVPNRRGLGILDAYMIDENDLDPRFGEDRRRWNARYKQVQDFGEGRRFLADLNFVSDSEYFLDYSRDPDRGSDPSALSRAEYVINRGYHSLNLRLERREQFFAVNDVIQTRLPEVDYRMRSRQMGNTPLFLEFRSTASVLEKSAPDFPDEVYGRAAFFPAISLPWSATSWLDITPTIRAGEIYYTDSLDPNNPTSFQDDLSREFVQFDTRILGPRFSKVFVDPDGGSKYKSTIEPRLTYRYLTAGDREDEDLVPSFDEIDILPAELNEVQYGLTTRLFARRLARTRPPSFRPAAFPDPAGVPFNRDP